MNFPTTGLPAWPQASPRAPGLPVATGEGFALAIDGAMALLATADGTTALAADAIPAATEWRSTPIVVSDPAPDAIPAATPASVPRTANPAAPLQTLAVVVPPTRDAPGLIPVVAPAPASPQHPVLVSASPPLATTASGAASTAEAAVVPPPAEALPEPATPRAPRLAAQTPQVQEPEGRARPEARDDTAAPVPQAQEPEGRARAEALDDTAAPVPQAQEPKGRARPAALDDTAATVPQAQEPKGRARPAALDDTAAPVPQAQEPKGRARPAALDDTAAPVPQRPTAIPETPERPAMPTAKPAMRVDAAARAVTAPTTSAPLSSSDPAPTLAPAPTPTPIAAARVVSAPDTLLAHDTPDFAASSPTAPILTVPEAPTPTAAEEAHPNRVAARLEAPVSAPLPELPTHIARPRLAAAPAPSIDTAAVPHVAARAPADIPTAIAPVALVVPEGTPSRAPRSAAADRHTAAPDAAPLRTLAPTGVAPVQARPESKPATVTLACAPPTAETPEASVPVPVPAAVAAPAQIASTTPSVAPAAKPLGQATDPAPAPATAPVARTVAAERSLPAAPEITPSTVPIVAVSATPAAPAAVAPVAARAAPIAERATLPGVLAAQTFPLMRVGPARAAAPVAPASPDTIPTAAVPAQPAAAPPAPVADAVPVSAIGAATLVRSPIAEASPRPPATVQPDARLVAPMSPASSTAPSAEPAARPSRAKAATILSQSPEDPVAPVPATPVVSTPVVAMPDAIAAIAQRPTAREPAVADLPRRAAPDRPETAEQSAAPATSAVAAPILPQMIPVATPLPTVTARTSDKADAAKPNSAQRAPSASGVASVAAQPARGQETPVAARDTAQPAATPDAPNFAEALPPAPADTGDARPAVAPLLTAEPPRTANPPPAAPRAHQPDAVPTPTVTARPGQIGHELGVEIARRVSAGGNELVVRLAPAELGRIEVRMAFDDRGGLTTVIAADSPVALDMLRRDSAELSRSLNDAGFRSDAQSLRFDSGADRGGDRSGGQPRTPWQTATQKPGQSDDFGPAGDFEQTPYRQLRTSGRYDLMA